MGVITAFKVLTTTPKTTYIIVESIASPKLLKIRFSAPRDNNSMILKNGQTDLRGRGRNDDYNRKSRNITNGSTGAAGRAVSEINIGRPRPG